MTDNARTIADNLRSELRQSDKTKRMKVKTLMKHFDYERRTEDSATRITEILSESGISIHPSIMKTDDIWQLKFEDQVSLSLNTQKVIESENVGELDILPDNSKRDKWFDELGEKKFRTEKEVESKFIVRLLDFLGYDEEDRYDGMSINASHGSKQTKLEADFVLYNTEAMEIKNQALLITEVKLFKEREKESIENREKRREKELENARIQVKSYSFWVSCHYGLITDKDKIEVLDLYSLKGGMDGKRVLFSCTQNELKDKFGELYKLISKNRLTHYYENLLKL